MKLAYCTPSSCGPASYTSRHPLAAFSALAPFFDLEQSAPSTLRPVVDVSETEAAYTAVVELPGVKREDVKLDLTQRNLTVTAERKLSGPTGESTRTYSRSFTLPEDVATENVVARLEDGVLTLTLPKAAEARSRRIELN